jgi:DNA helicase-2/ATP-dependent DNA helicase PcrA
VISQINSNFFFQFEKDSSLCDKLVTLKQPSETTTILRLKGLEKELVVWSLQAEILYENEVKEFAYTIMTRTNCMLIIAITSKYNSSYLDLVKLLRSDRLILWDSETSLFYNKQISVQ